MNISSAKGSRTAGSTEQEDDEREPRKTRYAGASPVRGCHAACHRSYAKGRRSAIAWHRVLVIGLLLCTAGAVLIPDTMNSVIH